MSRLSIHNGLVLLNGKFEIKDILIEDEIISKIADSVPKAEQNIDANGLHVFPGFIDAHVHFRVPGAEHKEDWKSGSKAALHGGITTVLDMPNNAPGITTVELLEKKREIVAKDAMVNYGMFFGATAENTDEIRNAERIAGVKVYMGSSTGNLLVDKLKDIEKTFMACKDKDFVAAVHAECEHMISENESALKEETGIGLHNKIRNPEVAAAATKDALELQKKIGNKLHVCHSSTNAELELVKKAKNRGGNISVEVCPHHIFLDESIGEKIGTFSRVNPPIRSRQDQQAVYKHLQNGSVDLVSTDHAPHTVEEKKQDYWKSPSGMPGIETVIPLLLNEASKDAWSLEKIGEWCSNAPARIYGIEKRGALEEGNYADVTIVDMGKEWIVKGADLFSKAKWSAFEGFPLRGSIEYTIVNGEIGFEQGAIKKCSGKEVY